MFDRYFFDTWHGHLSACLQSIFADWHLQYEVQLIDAPLAELCCGYWCLCVGARQPPAGPAESLRCRGVFYGKRSWEMTPDRRGTRNIHFTFKYHIILWNYGLSESMVPARTPNADIRCSQRSKEPPLKDQLC